MVERGFRSPRPPVEEHGEAVVVELEVANTGRIVYGVHEVAEDSVVIVIELIRPSRRVSSEEGVEAAGRVEDGALEELDGLGDLGDGRRARSDRRMMM